MVGLRMRAVAGKSRNASVGIHNFEEGVRGTGTYFIHEGNHIVLTAWHVIDGAQSIVGVSTPDQELETALILYADNRGAHDFAVLILSEPLETRTPMELKIYSGSISDIVSEQTVYTGNPGHHRQQTIFGTVSGIGPDGSIMLQSYAWGGASGSSVFDSRGRLIGILKAVDVNRSSVSPYPQINENVVWLSPPSSLDLVTIDAVLEIYRLVNQLQRSGGAE